MSRRCFAAGAPRLSKGSPRGPARARWFRRAVAWAPPPSAGQVPPGPARSGAGAGLLLLAALLGACVRAPPTPGAALVKSLRIEGTRQVDEGEVKDRIATTASGFWPNWLPFLGNPQYFDPNAWQADLRRIERYYQSLGYYAARVTDDAVDPLPGNQVAITVKVSEGAPSFVTGLSITGLEGLPAEEQATLLAELPLAKGARFEEADWATLKGKLLQRLFELGYVDGAITGEALVDVSASAVDLVVQCAPGPRYRFGKVFVSNAADGQVQRGTIVEAAQVAIPTGEWYRESALAEAQSNVFQLGVFGAVKVNRGAPDRARGVVDIVVDVREAPFRSVRAGGGLGIDQLRQEVRAIGEYSDRNFFGGLRRFSVKGKLGYATLPGLLSVLRNDPNAQSAPIARLRLEFEQPHVFARTLSFQTSVDLQTNIEPAFRVTGGTFQLGLPWRPRPDVFVFPSYNLDVFYVSTAIPAGERRAPQATIGCGQLCLVGFLEQRVEWDRRDDRLEPRTGFLLALSLKEGSKFLGGAFDFFSVVPEARGYVSFGKEQRVTLAGRVRLGTLIAPADQQTPVIARFFSGGSQMRGFSFRRLSPVIPVAESRPYDGVLSDAGKLPGYPEPWGGKGLFEASLELRWNVWGSLTLATFVDIGMVTWRDFAFGNLSYLADNMQYAVGLGLRYRTPIGPIRLDLATRLPIGGANTPRGNPLFNLPAPNRGVLYPPTGGCFGFGASAGNGDYRGAPEDLCALQLSIGEAF